MKKAFLIVRMIAKWVVIILVPVVLLTTSLRLLLTPTFIQIEYRTPGFPDDAFGFTQTERIKWASISLDYLMNDEGIDFLQELSFENGLPLFNERELQHMEDVKNLVVMVEKLWYGVLLVLFTSGIISWRFGWFNQFRKMMGAGGRLTLFLIILLLLFILMNFNHLFTGFHRIFFEGDTWLFLFSDTLIRLFPMRFWRDAFLLAGILVLSGALGTWYFCEYQTKK